ncbi:MAG TPA: hypothetical protein DCQ31_12280 [Bacteroidales bacterium]|nr:hypothetical protein [Bacteroidales bacterium]
MKFLNEPMEIVQPDATGSGKVYIFNKENQKLIISNRGIVIKSEWEIVWTKNSLLFECNEQNMLFNYVFSDKNMLVLKKDSDSEYLVFCNQNYFKTIEFTDLARYLNSLRKPEILQPETKAEVEIVSTAKGINYIKHKQIDKERAELSLKKMEYAYIDSINGILMNIFWFLFYFTVSMVFTKILLNGLNFDSEFRNFKFSVLYVENSVLWDSFAKVMVYGIPPLITLFFAILFQQFQAYFAGRQGTSKLFFLWGYLYGIGFFAGALLAGSQTGEWIGMALNSLQIGTGIRILILGLAVLGLVLVGWLANNLFINTTWSRRFVEIPTSQFLFKFRTAWFPYTVTLMLVALFTYFTSDYYWLAIQGAITFILIPIVLFIKTKNRTFIHERKVQRISFLYLFSSAALFMVLWVWSVL